MVYDYYLNLNSINLLYMSFVLFVMSQSQLLCENCQKDNHHSMQQIENCNCPCNNKVEEHGNLA